MPSAFPYNLTISDSHRFVWFRVAKVCTRTLLRQLSENGVRLDVEHVMGMHYPMNRYSSYLKFAFVRNPWDRLVSCYENKIAARGTTRPDGVVRWRHLNRDATFQDFVEYVETLDVTRCDAHLRLQSRLIDVSVLDFLGRYESFDRDLAEVFGQMGLTVHPLPAINRSAGRRPYPEYYTPELRERVARIYRLDLQIFGYAFE